MQDLKIMAGEEIGVDKSISKQLLIVISVVLLFLSCTSGKKESQNYVMIKDYAINILDEKLNAKSIIWGLAGNHKMTILSFRKIDDNECNPLTDYCFETHAPLIYEIIGDTLLLHVEKKIPEPQQFNSKVRVIQKQQFNYVLENMRKNYTDLGVMVID